MGATRLLTAVYAAQSEGIGLLPTDLLSKARSERSLLFPVLCGSAPLGTDRT